jgi:hypothetical protein
MNDWQFETDRGRVDRPKTRWASFSDFAMPGMFSNSVRVEMLRIVPAEKFNGFLGLTHVVDRSGFCLVAIA